MTTVHVQELRNDLIARLGSAKADLRRYLDGLDNEEIRQARGLAAKLRRGRVDVLHLGNSTVEWIDPGDTDRRPLHTMIAEQLRDPSRYSAVYGGSYSFALHEAYLRFALKMGRPKVILVPLWVRGQFLPWLEHPVFSRARATAALAEFDGSTPLRRIRRSFERPAPSEWAHYRSLKFETFDGINTVGDYVDRLKSPQTPAEEKTRLFYAYHLSHRIDPDQPELGAIDSLGRALRESGIPIVAYENPVPIDTGVPHWGEEFRRVNEENFALLAERFRSGYGSDVPILRTGMTIPKGEFLDPGVADEHLNQLGRTRLSSAIIGGLAAVRPDLVQQNAMT